MRFEEFRDKAATFINDLLDYFKFRWQLADKVGNKGTAGKIRQESGKIYNRALGQLAIIIQSLSAYGPMTLLNLIHKAKEAIEIEKRVDDAALKWTPAHLNRAQRGHEMLRTQTLEIETKLTALEADEALVDETLPENNPIVLPDLLDPELVAKRESFIQQFITTRQAELKMPTAESKTTTTTEVIDIHDGNTATPIKPAGIAL